MSNFQKWIQPVLSAICLVAAIYSWIIFAPPKIGGQTTYVVLVGNSMEPHFKRGDLVLVRSASEYQVGDCIAYLQSDAKMIFHRIVQIDDDAFVLKGDHNSWDDSYHPSYQEIIGKLWIHIPVAGRYLQILRTPGTFTIIVILFATLIFFTLFSSNEPDVERNNHINSELNLLNKESSMEKKLSDAIYLISAFCFIAIILAIASFSKPLEVVVEDNIQYIHTGKFDYFSYVPEDVFEGDLLQTGDPVFRQLNNSFNINFSYELSSEQPAEIQGTYRLLAIIRESSGWERTLEIIPYSAIVENSFTSEGILDLSEVSLLTDNLEDQTEIYNNRYTLIIKPEVIIHGEIGDRNFNDTFSPELNFSFDDKKLILIKDSTKDVLNPVENREVIGFNNIANSIPILGFKLNVLAARIISGYGILGSILAFVLVNKKYKKL